jgi:transcription elongation factor Elf1
MNLFCFQVNCPRCGLVGNFIVMEGGKFENKTQITCGQCEWAFHVFGIEIKGFLNERSSNED